MIKYVYKPAREGKRSTPNYRGRYKLPGQVMQDIALNTTDKRIAAKRLDEIVDRAVKIAGGETPPPIADVKTLRVHLEDWLNDLRAKKNSAKYISNMGYRIRKLMAACDWVYPTDVTRDSFSKWRAVQTIAPKTINDYQDAVCSLFSWMYEMERTSENPLQRLSPVLTDGNERRKRRAFTVDELLKLKAVCGKRWDVYMAAILTGLRRGELHSLVWGDVHLDHSPPYISVRSSTTKNRKPAHFVLRPDLLAILETIRPLTAQPTHRVFYRMVPTMKTFKDDLKKAGIAFVDAMGRRADFHALRHTTATELARAGVTERTAMEFMRHSDPKLTRKIYTDVTQLPTASVMKQLPAYTAHTPDKKNEMRSHDPVTSGQCLANNGIIWQIEEPAKTPEIPGIPVVFNCEGGTPRVGLEPTRKTGLTWARLRFGGKMRSQDLRRRRHTLARLYVRAVKRAG